jgi:endonuclease YncB( thermonuclease family)
MFRTLHKVMIGLIVCFWAGLAFGLCALAYEKRSAFYPLVDGVEAFKVWMSVDERVVGTVSGRVTKVDNDYAFQMKDQAGLLYYFRLAGIEIPDPILPVSSADWAWKRAVRTNLSELILSNDVQVIATFLNEQRSGLGLVFRAQTNVNVLLVEQGLAKIKPEYLKGLPLKPHYAFLRAQRRARERQAGLWKKNAVAEPATAALPNPSTLAAP